MKENESIVLKDGRKLGYAEYGDMHGKPVFFFHGWPGSRFAGAYLHETAKKFKLRLISIDRPGRGLSSHQPNRTLLDWANDIEEFADKVMIKKFSIMGVSGGGPYTLACAYKIPQRLISVGVVCGLGPITPFSLYPQNTISFQDKLYYYLLPKYIWFIPIHTYVVYFLVKYANPLITAFWFRNKPESDRQLIKNKHLGKMYQKSTLEGLRPPAPGNNQDYQLYCSSWGFEIKNIKVKKMFLWHGELDRHVPIWMARSIAKTIPNCRATYYPDMGHFLFADHVEDILRVFK